ncbi:hypothetical protein [Magnetovibrio blakemorei]|uniref:Uncharacterized protein n=1 Tax=Magnetovibrio blakemorei TaxID=28181 RepID=A0A1E5Q8N5_9PROT|nr:hypothetical protein [Magnetovibrio blakemorei]OEJ67746.1 hypothetical protein BEN30_08425 [Magnetovibrio blakemorei]
MADRSTIYASLFDIYSNQFTQQWQAEMNKSAYAFRTSETLKSVSDALVKMAALADQADTLETDIASGKIKDGGATAQISNLMTLMSAQKSSVETALSGVEGMDLKNLTKAATLDQPGLKTLAAALKSGADAALVANLNAFVNKITAGLNAAVQSASGSSHKTEPDLNSATLKALDVVRRLKGSVDPSKLKKLRRESGAATAFWLKSSTSST